MTFARITTMLIPNSTLSPTRTYNYNSPANFLGLRSVFYVHARLFNQVLRIIESI
uniref:Uncharacterized protein n=1 Tax=Lepeophtheirus salmonis TaxID=72036 RepID=A0A0K2TAI1_LEPSM